MRKKVILETLFSFVFLLGGMAMFYFLPDVMGANAIYEKSDLHDVGAAWKVFLSFFNGTFPMVTILGLSILGVSFVLLVIHIIMLVKARRPKALFEDLAFLVLTALTLYVIIVLFTKDFIKGLTLGSTAAAYDEPGGYITFVLGYYKADALNIGWVILCFAPVAFMAVGIALAYIAIFSDCIYLGRVPAKKSVNGRDTNSNGSDGVIVVHESDVAAPAPASVIASDIHGEKKEEGPDYYRGPRAAAEDEFTPYQPQAPYAGMPMGGNAVSGPFLVQYINTYSPGPSGTPVVNEPAKKEESNNVPVSEIQNAISGAKPLTADEIRRIVREEIGEKKDNSTPVIVSVPAPIKEEPAETKPLTADDVRAILLEEFKTPKEEDDVIVEPASEPALTAEDVRAIIAAELAKEEKKEAPALATSEPAAPAAIREEDVRAAIRDELAAYHRSQEEEKEKAAKEKAKAEAEAAAIEAAKAKAVEEAMKAKAEADAKAKAEEEEKTKREKEKSITAEDIRSIIAQELSRLPRTEEKKEGDSISPEAIRAIIRAEMKQNKPLVEDRVAPVSVIIRETEAAPAPSVIEKPVTIPTPAPVEAARVIVEEPKPAEPEPVVVPEPEPEPVVEKPAVGEKRPVGAINPNLPPHDKIIRIPFTDRMKNADPELKSNYNELKSEIMSYGVKCRTSNSGDTFRLHKVTYIKMTVAGKGLKLYMALDPKDYASTTLPVQDASDKKIYEAIPLVFKVKSDLSMRRAKQLIADVFEKANLEQGKVEPHNWADELTNDDSSDDEADDE